MPAGPPPTMQQVVRSIAIPSSVQRLLNSWHHRRCAPVNPDGLARRGASDAAAVPAAVNSSPHPLGAADWIR
ncbi:hypothetical protein GCM10027174_17460 [Salinifilum aidingensis]